MTSFLLGKEPRQPLPMELSNPSFGWTYESAGFGSGITYTCSHKHHQDVDEDHWITEPCEKCGADILGVDFEEPEYDNIGLSYKLYQISAGYYVIHPCGHIMHGIEVAQREEEENGRH